MFKSEAQIFLQNNPDGVPENASNMNQGTGSNDNGSESGMSGMPGMAGMPGMFGMQSMGGGMMPHDARLADEFMKLQQDFFKWQEQLLQNQHVLHSRVAPLASNPPQLQSVGVLRDIMSQSPSSANGAPELVEAHNPVVERKGPVERVINIQFIDGPSETDDSQIRTNSLPRLNQGVQDVTTGMSQLSSNDSGRPSNTQPRRWGEQPSVSVGAWTERPSQSVGVYQDRDYVTSAPRSQSTQDLSSTPVPEERQRTPPRTFLGSRGYTRPADSVCPETKSYQWPSSQQQQQQAQFAQPQQYQALPPDQQQQFAQFLQQQQQQEHPQQQWQQQQQPQQQWQPQQSQQPQPQYYMQPQQQAQPQYYMQPQQQAQPQPQYVQPQQQQPDKTAFWRDPEGKRQNLGLHKDQEVPDPTRPPRRSSRQDSPLHDSEASNPLPCFSQQAIVHEPPQAYYFNGDGNSAQSVIANSVSAPKPKEVETEVGGPRYTSVVTLSSDKNDQPSGVPPPKDKVRSVVQLNSGDRGQLRTAPVVRGFRQPGEEPPSQGGTIHSRIISSAIKGSQPSHSQTRSSISPPAVNSSIPPALSGPIPEAPTAARLVAAVSQPSKAPSPSPATSRISPPRSSPSRISPPRMSPTRISPARTLPSRVSPPSGPAFPNVQLRPVPAGMRASTPPESYEPAPTQHSPAPVAPSIPVAPPAPIPPPAPMPPPAPVYQTGSVPPPPPPAPPMAPPPPPAPQAMDGERRTASGKRIISSKSGPELDAREELMMAIKQHGGLKSLKRSGVPFHH